MNRVSNVQECDALGRGPKAIQNEHTEVPSWKIAKREVLIFKHLEPCSLVAIQNEHTEVPSWKIVKREVLIFKRLEPCSLVRKLNRHIKAGYNQLTGNMQQILLLKKFFFKNFTN